MPSKFEGLLLAAIEAQCSGLACITSDAVPAPDLIGRLDKIALSVEDAEWAHALLSAVDKPFNRSRASRMIAEGGYDIEIEANKLENFYLNLKTR